MLLSQSLLLLYVIDFNFYRAVLASEQLPQQEADAKGLLDFLFEPCNCKCGIPNREGRLIGGEFLKAYEFPWLVLLQLKNTHTALGTLINNKYVLTAASAVFGLTPYDIKVTLGQYDRCSPDISSSNVSINKIIVHPDFNPSRGSHNIALLKLINPVLFERRISPICLAHPNSKYVGQVGTVVSWFQPRETQNELGCRPRKLGLPILGPSQCIADVGHVQQDKQCLGILGSPSVVCKSDQGGPVLYRTYEGVYEIIGVLSDENDCNRQPMTAIYTAIGRHLSWIVQNTKDACYCTKS